MVVQMQDADGHIRALALRFQIETIRSQESSSKKKLHPTIIFPSEYQGDNVHWYTVSHIW